MSYRSEETWATMNGRPVLSVVLDVKMRLCGSSDWYDISKDVEVLREYKKDWKDFRETTFEFGNRYLKFDQLVLALIDETLNLVEEYRKQWDD